jgi:hypothetical protein
VSYPDDNPKTAVGATKVPLHLVPPVASHYLALAFKDGASKYGPYNWREHRVSASVYYGAIRRHADAWWDGEDVSRDALVHHLGHVMACCAILLDAMSVGKLNDDRPLPGAAGELQARYALDGVSASVVSLAEQPAAGVAELLDRCDEDAPTAHLKAGEAHEHDRDAYAKATAAQPETGD